MKSLIVSAALGLGALGLVGLTPSKAQASWLSEALHARFDPAYGYSYYNYAPAYGYPYYDYPYGTYYSGPTYYYGVPYGSYWYGPRYYRPWYGHRWHEHHGHEWHGGHGHGGHHR